jgi:hypothetical protein
LKGGVGYNYTWGVHIQENGGSGREAKLEHVPLCVKLNTSVKTGDGAGKTASEKVVGPGKGGDWGIQWLLQTLLNQQAIPAPLGTY